MKLTFRRMLIAWFSQPANWWQFWLPQSGAPGGIIMVGVTALLVLVCVHKAHADGGISGVIGAIISAGQPTSTSPDNYSTDGDDDE